MYQVFDAFLASPTWYTNRPSDRRRFFVALGHIVRSPAFEAEALGEYLVCHADNRRLDHAAWSLAAEARSVRDFLITTGDIVPR